MNELKINNFPTLDFPAQEAINTLCTNLSFVDEDTRRIMITSCQASEGKSFLSMNTMRSLAQLGKKVMLVDADLRRSYITAQYDLLFSTQKPVGLAHYLAGMCSINEILYSTDIDGACMVPIGHTVSNALPLLNARKFSFLLEKLTAHFDFVLVDAPPIGVVIDAAEIAKSCDGTLLAISYNRISQRELVDAKQQLEKTGCKILGAVLNKVEMDSYVNRKYYQKSYYSPYNTVYVSSKDRDTTESDNFNNNIYQDDIWKKRKR